MCLWTKYTHKYMLFFVLTKTIWIKSKRQRKIASFSFKPVGVILEIEYVSISSVQS